MKPYETNKKNIKYKIEGMVVIEIEKFFVSLIIKWKLPFILIFVYLYILFVLKKRGYVFENSMLHGFKILKEIFFCKSLNKIERIPFIVLYFVTVFSIFAIFILALLKN